MSPPALQIELVFYTYLKKYVENKETHSCIKLLARLLQKNDFSSR